LSLSPLHPIVEFPLLAITETPIDNKMLGFPNQHLGGDALTSKMKLNKKVNVANFLSNILTP
jgi:hypothetical protein